MLDGVKDVPARHRETLLETRVSDLLALDPDVLPLLIEHGFTPLENPVLRAALAPTVRLEQAFGLASLSPARRETLLLRLEEVVACR